MAKNFIEQDFVSKIDIENLAKQIDAEILAIDDKKLSALLDKFPYDNLSNSELDIFVSRWLNLAEEKSNDQCFKIIIDKLTANNILENIYPMISQIFTFDFINIEALVKLRHLYPKYEAIEHFYNIIVNEIEKYTWLDRIVRVYNIEDYIFFKQAYDYILANKIENNKIQQYIINKLKIYSDYADIPKWITFVDGVEDDGKLSVSDKYTLKALESYNDTVTYTEVPPYQVYENLMKNFIKFKNFISHGDFLKFVEEDNENIISSFIDIKEYYDDTTINDLAKIDLANEMTWIAKYKLMSNVKELFHLFGPLNVGGNFDFDKNNRCTIYGGCRMLYCNHHINTDDVDDIEEEYNEDGNIPWFTGSCDSCFNRIDRKEFAVRLPLKQGAWIGTYCSWECVIFKNQSTLTPDDYNVMLYYINLLDELKIWI